MKFKAGVIALVVLICTIFYLVANYQYRISSGKNHFTQSRDTRSQIATDDLVTNQAESFCYSKELGIKTDYLLQNKWECTRASEFDLWLKSKDNSISIQITDKSVVEDSTAPCALSPEEQKTSSSLCIKSDFRKDAMWNIKRYAYKGNFAYIYGDVTLPKGKVGSVVINSFPNRNRPLSEFTEEAEAKIQDTLGHITAMIK